MRVKLHECVCVWVFVCLRERVCASVNPSVGLVSPHLSLSVCACVRVCVCAIVSLSASPSVSPSVSLSASYRSTFRGLRLYFYFWLPPFPKRQIVLLKCRPQ